MYRGTTTLKISNWPEISSSLRPATGTQTKDKSGGNTYFSQSVGFKYRLLHELFRVISSELYIFRASDFYRLIRHVSTHKFNKNHIYISCFVQYNVEVTAAFI